MNTATLYTYAGTYWSIRSSYDLNGNLGTLTGDTGNLLNGNQSVIDFLALPSRTDAAGIQAMYGKRIIFGLLFLLSTRATTAGEVSFAIEIARYLFRSWAATIRYLHHRAAASPSSISVYFRIDDITQPLSIYLL